MLMRGGSPVLKPATAAEMTRDQLTAGQRANVWPGFSFLGDRGWGCQPPAAPTSTSTGGTWIQRLADRPARVPEPWLRPCWRRRRGGIQPHGKLLAIGSNDGTVSLWQVSLFAHTYAALCADAGPPAPREWNQYASGEPQPKVCA
jgi:hypothetical protein